MSILDDAIREHLELKRAHGADESEVKKLEDEAFGPPQRPGEQDAFAEAPTEFLTAPGVEGEAGEAAEAEGRRAPNIADLQEAPPLPEPSVEEQPAAEHQIVPDSLGADDLAEPEVPAEEEPKLDGVHTTEEREAIADQPTEMFDVEAEMQAGAEAESPSDEQLLDAEMAEPRLAPVDPIAGIEASAAAPEVEAEEELEDDDDDFFSEQRLSEELHNALDAPVTDEHSLPPLPDEPAAEQLPAFPSEETEEHAAPAPEPSFGETEEGTAIFDIEEHREGEDDEGAHQDEGESGEYEAIEPEATAPAPPAPETGDTTEANPYDPDTESHEDVLEDTPDFLEDAPEDDNAWFEQRPPKDFDFDD
jgi:hypothetical protein